MAATKTRRSLMEKEERPQPLPTKQIEIAVMAKLGRPSDLHSVTVHRYDKYRCRVNVRRNLTMATASEHFKTKLHSQYG